MRFGCMRFGCMRFGCMRFGCMRFGCMGFDGMVSSCMACCCAMSRPSSLVHAHVLLSTGVLKASKRRPELVRLCGERRTSIVSWMLMISVVVGLVSGSRRSSCSMLVSIVRSTISRPNLGQPA